MVKKSTLLAVIGGALCVVLVVLGINNVSAGVSAVPARPSLPVRGASQWIPFAADYEQVLHNGAVEVKGSYCQDSNGSVRYERSPASNRLLQVTGDVTLITIHNRVRRMTYARGPAGDWAQLQMPENMMRRPPDTTMRMPGLAATPDPESIEGASVYRYAVPGATRLLAPDLNFFALRIETEHGTERYFNLRRAEPAAELFMPPAGVEPRVAQNVKDLFGAHTLQ